MNLTDLKKERQLLENSASTLLSEALRAGAEKAEVCAAYGESTRISLEKQDFHLASSDSGYQFGLRVMKGQKLGFASCNSLDAADLKEIAERAVQIAGFSPENPYVAIPAPESENPKLSPPSADGLWDSNFVHLSLPSQKDWAVILAKEAMKDSRIRLNEGSVGVGISLGLVANSLGVHHLEGDTSCSWSCMGMAVEGDNITSFDYFSNLSRSMKHVPSQIQKTTAEFRESLLKNLKTGPGESYKGLVFFSPRAVMDILVSSLEYHLNARVVVEGSSRWKLTDYEKPILNSAIRLTDDPWKPDRAGCTFFDREGTPTSPLTLVDGGVLKTFLFDHYAAKALHQRSTGHAIGGPSTLPSVGTHCLALAGGTETHANLIARALGKQKNWLYVNRYSGQTDPVTGDFSGVAKSSEWWVNGQFQNCVKETLISGNFFTALGEGLFGLSQEVTVLDGNEESPVLVADGVSVTSK